MRLTMPNVWGSCAIALLMVGCHDSATGPYPPASTAAPSPAAPSPAAALTTFRVHGVVTEIVNGQVRPVAGVVGEDTYYHSAGVQQDRLSQA